MDSIKNRKPIRLREFDYSNGAFYYVTICTKNREEFFGKIENDDMILNKYGQIAKDLWIEIPNHFSNCVIDEFIIMPNHIHGILIIDHYSVNNNMNNRNNDMNNRNNHGCSLQNNHGNVGNNDRCSPKNVNQNVGNNDCCTPNSNQKNRNMELIPKIISQFKSSVTREIRKIYDDYNFGWQKSYYDHIIRNDNSLMKIRHYIKYNPFKWNEDENNLSISKL